jgi:hypothetical protein
MNNTKDWDLYQAGVKYNNALYGNEKNYYDVIDANLRFSSGDQWHGVKAEGLPKPVFNIIKRVKQFKVASLKSDSVTINIEPMEYRPDEETEAMQSSIHKTELANAEIKNVLEKIDYNSKSRSLLSDGFDTGDFCLHFYFNTDTEPYKNYNNDVKGSIEAEIIDSTNILFGNPNSRIVEKQPYIILVGRDFVKNLKEEFIKNGGNKDLANGIKADSNTSDMAGDNGKLELESEDYGKALYIIKYYKENGKVYANKSVENMYIYEKKDTGYTYYPVVFNNWEEVKGSYHGRSETTGIIPNQIAINKMFAMVIYHQMLTAFPTAVYNADKLENWTNEIGAQIPVTNLSANESIKNVAGYLEPASMSGQIMQAIELAMQYTKETLGVGDASLGNVTMNNASALIAVQKSNAVPLENVKAAFYEFTEDCGRVILDMMATNYGIRPVVVSENGERYVEEFNFDELKNMWLHVKADVGASSYFSEIASLQTLDNLLNTGLIEFVDYLKRIPDEIIPNKQELINDIEAKDLYKQALYNLMQQFMATLPPEQAQYLQGLEPEQMEREVLNMMGLIGGDESIQQNQNPAGMMDATYQEPNQPVFNENNVNV